MDRGDGYYNGPTLPVGVTVDASSAFGRRLANWTRAAGAIVTAWRAQGWCVGVGFARARGKGARRSERGGF